MSAWSKFMLLMWKNWLLQWRHPMQTIVEILAPVFFSMLLVMFRDLIDPKHTDTITHFTPFSPKSIPFAENLRRMELKPTAYRRRSFDLEDLAIAYSPSGPLTQGLIAPVGLAFRMRTYGVPNAKELDVNLTVPEESFDTILVGVEFPDDYATLTHLPVNIRYALRFPAETRFAPWGWPQDESYAVDWRTNFLTQLFPIGGPRNPEFDDGGYPPGYYPEGFLTIQYYLFISILGNLKNEPSPVIPEILMCRFPYPEYICDPLLPALEHLVSIIIMLSFIYTCISTVKVVTTEKERQLKEAMKIMGLPSWLHWLAWFLKVLLFGLLSIFLVTICMTKKWNPDSELAVFTKSTRPMIFVLLLFFFVASITFCFMISTFFSKANTAAAVAGLLWFLSYIPYLFGRRHFHSLHFIEKVIICLGHNSAMAVGFHFLIRLEGIGEGGHLGNIWTPLQPDDDFTMGHTLVMLLIDTILYMAIAAYVEQIFPGEFGVPQPWNYPFRKSYWKGPNKSKGRQNMLNIIPLPPSNLFEAEPVHLAAGIQIRGLYKAFGHGGGRKVAVNNLTLNMYEGQITALLGHNGAGKTTTMSVLTGMFPPTKGTAIINGYDICTDMPSVRSSLGFCPQYNILFDELTVREHIYFYSKLKGLAKADIEAEISKYLELLELVPKANCYSANLSGGMKRKLSVGVALCGRSKIVLFDEPTAGMDPSARRALWDLLKRDKAGRTSILSTHYMDEADLLGDRIAIMSGGRLQCCGSPFFLKKHYGAGYNLIMEKKPDCNVAAVTQLLQKTIPTVRIQSNVGSELSYLLPDNMITKFEKLLADLEYNCKDLRINSFGISQTTMEEVFMKVGAELDARETLEITSYSRETFEQISLQSVALNTEPYRRGFLLWFNKLHAMFRKKILSTFRSWIMTLMQNIIPVVFMVCAVLVVRFMKLHTELPELEITFRSYKDSIALLSMPSQSDQNIRMATIYKRIIREEGSALIDIGTNDMSAFILAESRSKLMKVRKSYLMALTFHADDKIKVWFSNQPYHISPLALKTIQNVMIKYYVRDDYYLHVSNKPILFKVASKVERLDDETNIGYQVALNLGFSMAFVSAMYIIFNVRERVCQAKHLQFVSGVTVLTFWIPSFLWDIITFAFTSLLVLFTLGIFNEEGFDTTDQLSRVFNLMMTFGAAMIPMMYVLSFLFEIPATGFTRMAIFNLFAGVAVYVIIDVMYLFGFEAGPDMEAIFLYVPHYCLSSSMRALYNIAITVRICNRTCESSPHPRDVCLARICKHSEVCCEEAMKEDYYAMTRPGIGRQIQHMQFVAICFVVILMLIEWRFFSVIIDIAQKLRGEPKLVEEVFDEDVEMEKRDMRMSTERDLAQYSLAVCDLTKYYGRKFVAVNRLCLGVHKYECFGLLGINGAGKTTTFKMLTGDLKMSAGNAWVRGYSLKTHMKTAQKIIGYCPQFDALIDDLTGRETLQMFCLLRGISHKMSKVVAVDLAKQLDFMRHIDKQVRQYSGGNKRKLSTAVALVSDPAVIYLDEPTAGMDPATRRHLWNVVCTVRDAGCCVVLTSHSMEECEALCTRLAIMVNGTFRCIGSVQHLKRKFAQGYTLVIKVKRVGSMPVDPADVRQVVSFVVTSFPSAVLREHHGELLTFYIADMTMPWSKMFGVMEAGKQKTDVITDYSLGQSSLEQVFLLFCNPEH